MFQLVLALWGQLVEGDEDTSSLYWKMAERKRRLSKWFQSVLKQKEGGKEVDIECVYVFNCVVCTIDCTVIFVFAL